MNDIKKTKAELIDELKELRLQNNRLKKTNTDITDNNWLSNNSNTLNRAIIDNSPLGISVRSSKGKLLSVNESWKKIWNLSDEQIKEFMNENLEKPNFDNVRESLGKWLPEVKNIYKKGGYLHIPKVFLTVNDCDRSCWVSLTYYAIKDDKSDVDRVIILTDDITDRVHLERGILESQSKYRSVIDNANIGVLVIQDNRMVFCNSKIYEMFGYTIQDYENIDFLSIIHPDDRPIAIERIKARLSGISKELKPLEIRAVCKSGKLKWIETNSAMIQWENKSALQAFVSDITERKLAEKALQKSETHLKSLFRAAPVGIGVAVDRIIKQVNNRLCDMTGYSKIELMNKNGRMLYPTDEDFEYVGKEKYTQIRDYGTGTLETRWQRKDRQIIDVMLSSTPLDNNDLSKGITFTALDITDRKRDEKQQMLMAKTLDLLNKSSEETDTILEILDLIKEETGFDAVGIRLKQGDDYPYYETRGFSKEFVKRENSLCVYDKSNRIICDADNNPLLECMCGNIIRHKTDPTKEFFTKGGSFWTNNTSKLLATTSEDDRQSHTRNRCNGAGYESVALIPLQSQDEIIGLLQLNDKRRGMFTPEMIMFFERMGSSIGIALRRKLAEKALWKNKEKYRLLVENLNSSIVNYSPDGTIIYCSPNVIELGGYDFKEEIGQHFTKYVADKADLVKLQEIFKKILTTKKSETFEFLYRPKDKKPFYVEAIASPVFKNGSDNLESISCIVSDITERKKSEEALRDSEEHYRNIYDNALLGIFRAKISDGTFLEINSKAAELLGLPAEEIIGKMRTSDLYKHPDQRKQIVTELKERGELYGVEIDMILPDGQKVTFSFSVKAYPDLDYLEGVVVDVTKRKQAEEERRKLEAAVKYSSELINLATLEGNMIFLNEAGSKMLGIDPDDVKNVNIMQVIPENWIELVQNGLLPALMNGGNWKGDLQYQNLKTGELIDVHATTFTVNDPKTGEPQFLANVSLDITETKRLREQESRALRLESAGRVAGQIAHDFNNLLAPLVAYPDFIKEELPGNHPSLKYIDDMEKSANKIAEINQQLLTLSRRGHYNQEILNLNDVIRFAIGEIGILPQTLVIETDFANNLMNVKGGEAQIGRVLSNLIHNARDAMQDIGNITIKTENYYADNPTINYGQIPKGEYVKVTISDIGSGIPEDIQPHMFDPFFTTKTSDQRRGSGLGLSVVDAVMKDHDGFIDIQSTIGVGTSFYLYFPITRESMETTNDDEIIGGAESILVIDDDETQCQVALKILEKLGYKATAVNSGEKAIEYLKSNPQDLLILDMIMPDGIDGTETLQQILEIYPNQKAIIVSGFAESSRVEKARQLGIDMYIRKPLTLRLLASCIRKTLDKKEAPVNTF